MVAHSTTLLNAVDQAEFGNPTTVLPSGLNPSVALLIKGIALRESRPEEAKDALSEASRSLEGALRDKADIHLAIAYSWTGEYAEGLALIETVLSRKLADQIRFQAMLAKATLQMGTPRQALSTLSDANEYIEGGGPTLRGMWHNQRARALKELKDYDQASIEYAGAAAYFEEAGNPVYAAIALNNVAGVLLKWGKYDEAYEAVSKAVLAFATMRDPMLLHAQDQEAQILIAMGRTAEAKRLIDEVIKSLEGGDKKELLLESLLTRAKALAQAGSPIAAFTDLGRAGELSEYLARPDLRLTVAKVKKEVTGVLAIQSHVEMVDLALKQSNGAVRNAAARLGIAHASLIKFIKNHGLTRKPVRPTSIISKPLKK